MAGSDRDSEDFGNSPNSNLFDPNATIINVPKPASILAEEKRLGAIMEPYYATMGGGNRGTVEYGPPIGYSYANDKNQYVQYDASGNFIGTQDRGGADILKFVGGAALSFLLPGVGSAIAESLIANNIVTSQLAANVIGNAIANTAANVAQGQPLDKALTNAVVGVAVNTGSIEAAKEVNVLFKTPAVSDAIVSAAGSAVKTAAAGGTEQDIVRNMTGALVGSAASSAYQKANNNYTRETGRVIGSAVAGAVTGGITGAITGAVGELGGQAKGKVSGAIEDIKDDIKDKLKSTPDTAALPPSEVAALTPDTDAGVASGTSDLNRVEVSGKALPPDITSTNIIDTIARTTPATPPPPEVAAPPKLETVEVSGKALPKVPDITDTDVINAMTKTSYSEGTTPGFPTVTVTATKPKDTTDITKTDIIQGSPRLQDVTVTGKREELPRLQDVTVTGKREELPRLQDVTVTGKREEPFELEPVTITGKREELIAATPEEKLEEKPEEKTTEEKPYKPNLFILGGKQPKAPTKPSTSVLSQALGTTGLTAYRGAGEIEDPSTGKKRRKVWNEETLRLKDALGV